jgi:phosphatidylserine decarboxylase
MIHKEGLLTLGLAALMMVIINGFSYVFFPDFFYLTSVITIIIFVFLLSFFRNPDRVIKKVGENLIYAPADGKIVVSEKAFETEYLNEERHQLSIFMSPLNVHVNRNPVSGTIVYYRYHAGKFLMAWNPKTSTENERTTIVYNTQKGSLLMRQIAGFLARRIVCYAKEGAAVNQGEDIGFIKFGSRVDLFLPQDCEILVKPGDVVFGNKTVVAKWK